MVCIVHCYCCAQMSVVVDRCWPMCPQLIAEQKRMSSIVALAARVPAARHWTRRICHLFLEGRCGRSYLVDRLGDSSLRWILLAGRQFQTKKRRTPRGTTGITRFGINSGLGPSAVPTPETEENTHTSRAWVALELGRRCFLRMSLLAAHGHRPGEIVSRSDPRGTNC